MYHYRARDLLRNITLQSATTVRSNVKHNCSSAVITQWRRLANTITVALCRVEITDNISLIRSGRPYRG